MHAASIKRKIHKFISYFKKIKSKLNYNRKVLFIKKCKKKK